MNAPGRRARRSKYMNCTVETGDRVHVAQYADPDGTPAPGTVTSVGGPIPGVGCWITIRLDRGDTVVTTDEKVSTL